VALVAGYHVRMPALKMGHSRLTRPFWDRRRLAMCVVIGGAIAFVALVVWGRKMAIELSQLGNLTDFSRKRYFDIYGAEYARSTLSYYVWAIDVAKMLFYTLIAYSLTRKQRINWVV